MRNLSNLIILGLSFVLFSCAKTDEEAKRSAIQEAKFHLNSMDCSKAKKVLDDLGFQDDDGDYISIYASSQACVAGYKELDLFGTELTKISSSGLIASLATFSSSNETENDSTNYTAINDAITTLISNDGVAQPSTTARNSKFGNKKSGDLSMQALYLIFVQMGKHFALYGNALSSSGAKGAGGAGNSCLYSYTQTDAAAFITVATSPITGTCTVATGNEGSSLLKAPETAADIKRRLCQGVVYFNNMLDILGGIVLPSSSELGDISNISTALDLLMLAAEAIESGATTPPTPGFNSDTDYANSISIIKDITGQTQCEALPIQRIEKFYAIFFESIYQ